MAPRPALGDYLIHVVLLCTEGGSHLVGWQNMWRAGILHVASWHFEVVSWRVLWGAGVLPVVNWLACHLW